jgi:hypothetical protein
MARSTASPPGPLRLRTAVTFRYQMRNATIGGYGNTGYDMGGNNWNNGAFGQNNTLNGLGGTGSRRPQSKGRAGLPSVRP